MKYSLIYQSTKKLIIDTNAYRHSLPSKEVDVGRLAKSKIFFHKIKATPAQPQSTCRGITVQSIINSDSGQQKSQIISLSEYAVLRYEAGRCFLLKFSIYCHFKHQTQYFFESFSFQLDMVDKSRQPAIAIFDFNFSVKSTVKPS